MSAALAKLSEDLFYVGIAVLIFLLVCLGTIVASNGIRLWRTKRQWRKWATKK